MSKEEGDATQSPTKQQQKEELPSIAENSTPSKEEPTKTEDEGKTDE